jgi:hypothetical protein
MSKRLFASIVGFLAILAVAQLTSAEKGPAAKAPAADDGLLSLFDGKSLDGWTTASGEGVTKGWNVEDGLLVREQRGGAIYSKDEYGDFELDFDWKISERGNSGVKYRLQFYEKGVRGRPGWLGCEYQLLDDEKHPNAKKATTSAGALYSLYAPNKRKSLNPAGEFNHSRIVVRGTKFEHWLNGRKIVSADTSSETWKKRIAKSKFAKVKDFAQNAKGRIQIQDHGSKVWFRNITLKPLDTAEQKSSNTQKPSPHAEARAWEDAGDNDTQRKTTRPTT